MAETITVNAVDRSGVIPRKDVEWAESAYLGEVGEGHLLIQDDAGTIDVPGHKAVSVDQSSSTPARIFTGFTGRKGLKRGETYSTGAGREVSITVQDLNVLLNRIIIRRATGQTLAAGGKRPAETISARLIWLLASDSMTGLVTDRGAVTYPTTVGMDAADYRGQYPGDVLGACAKAVRFNYYVRYHASGPELVFRDDNASTSDTSTVTITNDGTANSTSSFAPIMDAELTTDPEHVYSGAYGTYAKGAEYVARAATATAFASRDGVTEDSGSQTAATATRDATTFLWESHTEEQLLTLTIRMRAAYVGLVQAGQRISVKMTHLLTEGWSPAIYARILRKRVTQPLNTDNDYDVALDLSPQESGPPTATILQSAFDRSADGGKTIVLPNPVTVGSLLVFASSARLTSTPGAPNTAPSLARFGAGAWAKVPNNTANTYSTVGGVAIWVKAADSTESSGYVGTAGANMGIWEISVPNAASTIAALTSVYKTQQAESLTMTIGSLGSPATGTVGILILAWEDEVSGPTYVNQALPGLTSGVWTVERYDSAYEGPWIKENSPYTVIADTAGTGVALSASITKAFLASPFVAGAFSGNWCGAAILITPV